MTEKETIRERARDDYIDERGRERPDPIPMAPPVGYQRQPSITERIREMVRSEHLRLAALQAGQETFEEADDFDTGEDLDPHTPYEEVFDPIEADARMALREADHRASVEARAQELRPSTKETSNADDQSDKGRTGDSSRRAKGSDKVDKGDAKSDDKSYDEGGKSKV